MSGLRFLAAALLGLVLATDIHAQDLTDETRWLTPDIDTADTLANQPRRVMVAAPGSEASPYLVALGEVAFRSPDILGPVARRGGLSCNVCHPNGHAAVNFFAAGLSDLPGNVDLTSAVFRHLADDGLFNPVNIPSLRGVAATAPYGREGLVGTIRRFTQTVIVSEFGGDTPSERLLDALVAYQVRLGFPLAPHLLANGRLTPTAPEAARRGEVLFVRSGCARCHVAADRFVDHRRHDVGSGGAFDTPSLLGLTASAPYFHDGRYNSLEDVVGHFDSLANLGLDSQERRDLVAYLAAVGAAGNDLEPVTLAGVLVDLRRFGSLLDTTLAEHDPAFTSLLVGELHRMMARLSGRFPAPEQGYIRGLVLDWAIALRTVERHAEAGEFAAAQAAFIAYMGLVDRSVARLSDAAARSLFDPRRLAAFLATKAKETPR
jgi:cytochrome c peroxidase